MKLYHFTSRFHMPLLLARRAIKTTHNNLHPVKQIGPEVVWLTNLGSYEMQLWAEGSVVNKAEFRITVELPEGQAHHWPIWSRKHGIDEGWYEALGQCGVPQSWFVVERPIGINEWVSVERFSFATRFYESVPRELWITAGDLQGASA